MRLLLAAAGLALLASCSAPSKAQRVQEAAYELNMGLRFGYTAMALDKVASAERKDFLRRHRDWNGRLRVVDLDLNGMNVRDGEADVFVAVNWQRVDSTDVRTTVIHQRWKDDRGNWNLIGESRAQGDTGLLGEDEKGKKPGESAGEKRPDEPSGEGDKKPDSQRYQTTIIR